MRTRHPPRLAPPVYRGLQRYFLTICCANRRRFFTEAAACDPVIEQLRTTSRLHGFAVPAYVLMPDHAHIVTEAEHDDCDLLPFVMLFKQKTAYEWKPQRQQLLWQHSFYDHVLRDSEDTRAVVRYVLENPCAPAS